MKKIIFALSCFTLLFTSIAMGQKRMPDDNSPQINKMRMEFFNQELQFSDAEQEVFWPAFDQFRADLREAQEAQRKPRLELMSDAEAEKFLDDHFTYEENLIAMRRNFVDKLRGKINIRKIALISHTEKKFKRELFKRLRERRDHGESNKRRF